MGCDTFRRRLELAMMNKNRLIALWFILTSLLAQGFISAYFSQNPPSGNRSSTILDETKSVVPNQIVVFNMTNRYEFNAIRPTSCYYIWLKALVGNFTIYESNEPVSWHGNLTKIGLWYGKVSSERNEYQGCLVRRPYLIIHFGTFNAFRVQVTFVRRL